MKNKVQHVEVPQPKEKETSLKPFDYLVYANIRRYVNKDTMTCFPSLDTIADKCGSTIPTIRQSIKRLLKEKMFEAIIRTGQSTMYKFTNLLDGFEMFTSEFLDSEELTPEEKAYLIGLQAKSYKNNDLAITTYSNSELSSMLNLSRKSIIKYNKSLREKEIMSELQTSVKNTETGLCKSAKVIDLNKIGQAVLFINERVDNHEERIQQLEKELKMVISENRRLSKENERLKCPMIEVDLGD